MASLTEQLAVLEQEARAEVGRVSDLEAVQTVKVRFLGRKGLLTDILRQMGGLSPEERPVVGQRANAIKCYLEAELAKIAVQFQEQRVQKARATVLDVTLPGRADPVGHQHPLTTVFAQIKAIFVGLGFSIYEGPEVETDYYNFSALNVPPDHPARDMQDTFYVSARCEVQGPKSTADPGSRTPDSGPLLLRTHTSPVQIRVMERTKPPLRMIAPGRVYRRDADITHSPMFHQVEGLYVDTQVTLGDLKGVLTLFVHELFGTRCPVRFRPSFFPFTEPSAEVDIGCMICGGGTRQQTCRVCKGTGWLEILGSGMVHPAVLRKVGYDPRKVSGFAFGLGVERIAMLKYGIDDIRLFYSGDLRFLEQF